MMVRVSSFGVSSCLAGLALLALASTLFGCAEMGDTVATAFADPGRYELWDCKQLEPERKNLVARAAELQGLMAKAETGAGGAVVAELAYRNDYVAVRGQQKFLEEAWRRNNCHETPAAAQAPATAASKPSVRSPKPVK